jgi:hypothetical protein
VLGLVRGWGEVAIHGHEGFRAERASVVMLFSDLVGPRSLTPMRWWHGRRARVLRDAAGRYGVPVLPLRTALDHRVLEELGLPRSAIAQAGQLVRPSQWWAGREFPAGLYGGEKP